MPDWGGPDVDEDREAELDDLAVSDEVPNAFKVKVTTKPLVSLVMRPVQGGES